jgi:hypothetical protein
MWIGQDAGSRFALVTRSGCGRYFESVFDLFASVFEVAFGLIGLAIGFEDLSSLPCRDLP